MSSSRIPESGNSKEGEAKPDNDKWRVGRKLGRTLYIGDRFIGSVDTRELASQIVEAVNAGGVSTAGMTELLDEIIMSANGAIQGAARKPDLHQCGSCIDNWRKLRKLAAHVLAEKGK